MRLALLVGLAALGGCVERYLVPERSLERTLDLDRWEKGRAAFPAVRLEDGERVWVLNRRIKVSSKPDGAGMIKARRTRPGGLTYGGAALAIIGSALFFGVGGAAIADLPNADRDTAECHKVNGLFCGLGSDIERGFGGVALALGVTSNIVGAVMMYYGTVRSAEVKPGLREYIYVRPIPEGDD